ncbi:MAG: 1-deoxy-D-xylulose-5-phosphate reductoisomerase [Geminicoccaceae bacterium]
MIAPPSRDAPRSVTVLGATGSIGSSTLALIEENPSHYVVEAVTAATNSEKLAAIARRVGARLAVVADPEAYASLKVALSGSGIEAAAGEQALTEAATRPADWVMAAIVGAAGLAPTLAAVRRGATVALANKECLVCAGELFMREVARSDSVLLPVDSEHNAIFQAMAGSDRGAVARLILTASGGPFRTATRETMAAATPEQAVAHPNWSMGAKISIDSATMMNKGLEVIEAHHLFAMPESRIDVLVHPQSVVHSLVAFSDGSQLAQLGAPDMRIPIAYTLGWPARLRTTAPALDLGTVAKLEFFVPDMDRFPALRLARLALQQGGSAPTILNAANEVAVSAFLACRIGFLDIARIVATTLESMPSTTLSELDAVYDCDRAARQKTSDIIASLSR